MTQFKKGNKYNTITEFAPVVEAALKMWPNQDGRPYWFEDSVGCGGGSDNINIDAFPMTLFLDVPDEVTGEVTPLTVKEIREANREVWYICPDSNQVQCRAGWSFKEALISRPVPCYATKADCQRANGLEVE